MNLIKGQLESQYELLWDFATEIKRTNPRSNIVIETRDGEGICRFDKMYMCFNGIMVRFMSVGPLVIGIYGCFLDSRYVGSC